MQVVKKIFFFLLVLWLALLFFMPKQELYYKLETELAKNDIKINEQSIDEGFFSLTLNNATVYVKGIALASIEKIDFFTVLFYTNIEFNSLNLDDSLSHFAPTKIDTLSATHAIWNPINVEIKAQGAFGSTEGEASLLDRTIRLDFNETKHLGILKSNLKKDQKGWFYETTF